MGQESGRIDTVEKSKEGECRTVFSALSMSLVLEVPGVWGRQVGSRALFCYSKSLEGIKKVPVTLPFNPLPSLCQVENEELDVDTTFCKYH